MRQLVQLDELYDEFEKLDTAVLAVSNEERMLSGARKVLARFDNGPRFLHAADLNRQATTGYERTSLYFIDKKGIVRQVFPMEIYERGPWWAVINELKGLVRVER